MTARKALLTPGFGRYYAGAVAAVNGNWVFRVLLSWMAWDMTHSPTFVGIIAAASLAPVALTAPFFGALADRMDLLTAYRRVSVALALCPVALLALVLTGFATPVSLLGISLLFGVVLSAYHPVRQSIGPRLVDPPLIASVVALAALNFNVGRLLSPAIGGLLVSQFGTTVATAVSALLFLPAVLIAATLAPRPAADRGAPKSYLADLREGIAQAWQQLPLRHALFLTIAALGPVRAVTEILALIADGSFGQGAQGLGLLTSAIGGGALLAAIFQVLTGQSYARFAAVRFAVIALGFLSTAALAFAPTFGVAIALAVPVGFAGTYVGVSLQVAIQADLDDRLRGRIMSLWMLSMTLSTSALSLMIAVLSEWAGIGWATTAVLMLATVPVALIALRA